jgi:hypothetical protein
LAGGIRRRLAEKAGESLPAPPGDLHQPTLFIAPNADVNDAIFGSSDRHEIAPVLLKAA